MLFFLFVFFIFYFNLFFLNKKIRGSLYSYVDVEVERVFTNIVNRVLRENNVKFNDYLIYDIDSSNNNISYDIDKVNEYTDCVSEKINNEIFLLEHEDINRRFDYKYHDDDKFKYVRSGLLYEFNVNSIYNNTLFSNIGASIPLKISFLGSVNSNIEIKTKDYGINNLIVEAYLNINVKCYTTMPLGSKIHEISINELIFVDIIKGEIPNYYISDVK